MAHQARQPSHRPGEYRRMLSRYLGPQRTRVSLMAGLLLASIGMQLAGPQVARGFIDAARSGSAQQRLIGGAALFLAVAAAQQVLRVLATYASEQVAWTATNELRADLAAHVLRLDPGFFKRHTPGELIERVDGDVNALADFFGGLAVQMAGSGLLLAGVIVAVWLVDARLGPAFAALTLGALALLLWLRGVAVPHWQRDREHSAAFYGYVGEALSAAEDLRASGAVGHAMHRFFEQLRAWLPVRLRAEMWGSAVWIAATIIFAGADALAFGLGGTLFQAGAISIGTVYLVVAYAAMLAGPIGTIRVELQHLQRADAAMARINELFSVDSALADGHAALPIGPLAIEFCDVSFAYPGGEASDNGSAERRQALSDISFQLRAGRVLGLLGRTGSGKTSLARLLFRFYDPQQGQVLQGGIDTRRVAFASLRARVGLVTQDVQLFEASLRDNMTFFDPDVPDARLLDALHTLGLGTWLARLPGGLDAHLSASALSAGEAQLIAMARVLLQDPGLVILDEASSRLDPATEALLSGAVRRLLRGRTGVIIAHRLATVEWVDDILIVEDGRGVEHGPRAELAADPQSHYSRLRRTRLEEVLP